MRVSISSILTVLSIFCFSSPAASQTATTNFTHDGDTATVSVQNSTSKPCYVDFEVEAKYKLISSGSSEWRQKIRASWKLPSGTGRSEEIYERDAEAWRVKWTSNECD